MPVLIHPGEGVRIGQAQIAQAADENPLGGTGQGAVPLAGQPLEVFHQLIELKEDRARVRVVEQNQIIHRGNVRQQIVA